MRRYSFLRHLLGAALLAVLLAACGTPAAPVGTDPDPDSTPVAPSVTGFSPAAALRGSSVVIAGSDFGNHAGTVTIGGHAAQVSEWSDGRIEVTVPAAAPNAWQELAVTTDGGSAVVPELLFVGAEFSGEGAALQEFLGRQPQGGAVLLGARTYDLAAEELFWIDNIDLYGRGADLTHLRLPSSGAFVLADFGAVTQIADLSTSGAPFLFAEGTFANVIFPPPGGPRSVDQPDIRAHVAELAPLAAPRPRLRPTIALSNVDLGQGFGALMLRVGAFDLEVHDSIISVPNGTLVAYTMGDVLLSGVTAAAHSVSLMSIGGSVHVSGSDLRFVEGVLAGSGGVSISDSEITAEDGDIEIIGEQLWSSEDEGELPGGPVVVTGSTLRALVADHDGPSWGGSIYANTRGAPVSFADNLELVAHRNLELGTGKSLFGEAGIEFVHNGAVRVGVVGEVGGPVAGGWLRLSISDSGNLSNHVTFAHNDLTVLDGLFIEGDNGNFSLDFRGNTGVLGGSAAGGGLYIEGESSGAVEVIDNDLQIHDSIGIWLWSLPGGSVRVAGNRFAHPESLLGAAWFAMRGFADVVVNANEIAVSLELTVELAGSQADITNNRFSVGSSGVIVMGDPVVPAQRVQFSGNEVEYGHLGSDGPGFYGVNRAVIEGNRVTAGTTGGSVSALTLWHSDDMAATVSGNTFSGFDRALTLVGTLPGTQQDVIINYNVFDVEISEPGSAAVLHDVASVIDARHNVWGANANVADVAAAVLLSGATEEWGGGMVVDPLSLP